MKRILSLLLVLLFAIGLLAGCAAGYNKNAANYYGADSSQELPAPSQSTSESEHILVPGKTTDRKLIYRASLSIRTDTYHDDYTWINNKLVEAGGYLAQESTSGTAPESSGDTGRYSYLELRIPVEKLETFLSDLSERCKVVEKRLEVEDNTDAYYDLDVRIHALELRYAKLEEYLASAEKLEDLLTLEKEMSEVLSDLDTLKGQKVSLDRDIAYSTVQIKLYEVVSPSAVSYAADDLGTRIKNGLLLTLRALRSFLEGLVVVLVSALPVLLLIGAVTFAVLGIVRLCRRRKKAGAPSSKAPAAGDPPAAS